MAGGRSGSLRDRAAPSGPLLFRPLPLRGARAGGVPGRHGLSSPARTVAAADARRPAARVALEPVSHGGPCACARARESSSALPAREPCPASPARAMMRHAGPDVIYLRMRQRPQEHGQDGRGTEKGRPALRRARTEGQDAALRRYLDRLPRMHGREPSRTAARHGPGAAREALPPRTAACPERKGGAPHRTAHTGTAAHRPRPRRRCRYRPAHTGTAAVHAQKNRPRRMRRSLSFFRQGSAAGPGYSFLTSTYQAAACSSRWLLRPASIWASRR